MLIYSSIIADEMVYAENIIDIKKGDSIDNIEVTVLPSKHQKHLLQVIISLPLDIRGKGTLSGAAIRINSDGKMAYLSSLSLYNFGYKRRGSLLAKKELLKNMELIITYNKPVGNGEMEGFFYHIDLATYISSAALQKSSPSKKTETMNKLLLPKKSQTPKKTKN